MTNHAMMKRRIVAVAGVSALAAAATTFAQPVAYRTLVRSGQPAPGVTGATFDAVSDVRISAAGGLVAFRANLMGTGVTTDTDGSIWVLSDAAPQMLYREGTPVAGTTAVLTGIPTVNLNTGGYIGFAAALYEVASPNQPTNVAYFCEVSRVPGGATIVTREVGWPAPSPRTILSMQIPFNGGEHTAWSTGMWGSLNGGAALGSSGGETFDTTTPVPGIAGVTFRNFSSPALGAANELAFRAAFGATTTTAEWAYGLFTTRPGSLTMLARTGGGVAGLPDGVVWREFGSAPVLGPDGHAVVWGRFEGGGVVAGRDTGVFASNALDQLEPIVKAGDPVANIGGATFASFSRNIGVASSGAGAVVFLAFLDDPMPGAGNSGIFISEAGRAPRLLARRGDHLNGMPHGSALGVLNPPQIGGDHKVAFTAFLTGPGVTQTSNFALFGWDSRVRPTMLLRTGTAFQIPGGPPKVIRHISFDSEGEATGRSQMTGRTLVFKLTFTDNSHGLFAATLPCIADFDGDGDVGADGDIEAFFACIAGDCCATCGSADFDGDGDPAMDADIEAFFRALAGNPC